MSTEQPEALRLIEQLPDTAMYSGKSAKWSLEAIAELRRLHEMNQDIQGAWAEQSLTILAMQKTQEELVEALEDLVKSGESMGWSMTKQKAAIAKAKGKSNDPHN